MDCLPVDHRSRFLRNACQSAAMFDCARYILAVSRHDGAEKAERHQRLSDFYTAVATGCDPDNARRDAFPLYKRIHDDTKKLTDNLDREIGLLPGRRPDLDAMKPAFFDRFHDLAITAIRRHAAENSSVGRQGAADE